MQICACRVRPCERSLSQMSLWVFVAFCWSCDICHFCRAGMSCRVNFYSLSGGGSIGTLPGVVPAAWGGPWRARRAVRAAPKTRNCGSPTPLTVCGSTGETFHPRRIATCPKRRASNRPNIQALFHFGDALAFQVRSPVVARPLKGRTTRIGALGSSHKLLPPPRRAGVDHKPSATAAPPGGHLAESNLAMVTIADELCGHE